MPYVAAIEKPCPFGPISRYAVKRLRIRSFGSPEIWLESWSSPVPPWYPSFSHQLEALSSCFCCAVE